MHSWFNITQIFSGNVFLYLQWFLCVQDLQWANIFSSLQVRYYTLIVFPYSFLSTQRLHNNSNTLTFPYFMLCHIHHYPMAVSISMEDVCIHHHPNISTSCSLVNWLSTSYNTVSHLLSGWPTVLIANLCLQILPFSLSTLMDLGLALNITICMSLTLCLSL